MLLFFLTDFLGQNKGITHLLLNMPVAKLHLVEAKFNKNVECAVTFRQKFATLIHNDDDDYIFGEKT